MSAFSQPQSISGTLDAIQYELDGYVLAIHPATVLPTQTDWQISMWDDAGNQIYDFKNMNGDMSDAFDIFDLWHARDDGDGAFTLFYLSDIQGTRTPTQHSFDSNGNTIGVSTYEFATQTIDIFGVPVTQTLFETYGEAVDIGDGRIATFGHDFGLGSFHNVVIYNADGTIASRTDWNATVTGTGAAAVGGNDIALSGNNLFVFHMNTGLGGDNAFEVYGRVLDVNGNFVTDEFQVSEGDHVQGTFGFGSGEVVAETLVDGTVVVAYVSNKTGVTDPGTIDIFYKMYNPDGSVFAAERLANTGLTDQQQGQVRVHAQADGGFVLTYNHNDYDTLENSGVLQSFDANGNPEGGPELPLDRFQFADTSVIFENGFGYVNGLGTGLYTVAVDGATPPPPPPPPPPSGDTGTAGADLLQGSDADDTLRGLAGNDTAYGGAGDDLLDGGDGNDELWGGAGLNTFYAGAGADLLGGGNDGEMLFGGTGNDTMYAAGGDDLLDGGDGSDLLWTGQGDNTVYAGAGDDTVGGDAGDDLLWLGTGSNVAYGGAGDDRIGADNGNDEIWGGDGRDTIYGAGGDDTLSGAAGDDEIWAGLGDDVVYASDGDDTLSGVDGDDTLWAGDGDDVVYGAAGNDQLEGSNGADEMWGGDGLDTLNGGDGADTLNGAADDDTLDGGAGDDQITGGTGNDTFVFSAGDDTVGDFDAFSGAEDVDLRGVAGIADFADLKANHLTQEGADAVIRDTAGNSLTLTGVDIDDLGQNDFLF